MSTAVDVTMTTVIADALLDDALLGVVLEVRRQALLACSEHVDEEAFSVDAFTQARAAAASGGNESQPAVDAFGKAPPALPTDTLACPNCSRSVGASRFAPHLEKCLGKGRTAQRAAAKRAGPTKELYVPSWSPKRPAGPKKAKVNGAAGGGGSQKQQQWDAAFLPPGFCMQPGQVLRTADVSTWTPKPPNSNGMHSALPTAFPQQNGGMLLGHSSHGVSQNGQATVQRSAALSAPQTSMFWAMQPAGAVAPPPAATAKPPAAVKQKADEL